MRGGSPGRSAFRRWFGGLGALIRREFKSQWPALALALVVVLVLLAAFGRLTLPPDAEDGDRVAGLSVSASLVDEDRSFIGQAMVNYLEDISYISAIYQDDLETALDRLERDQVMAVLRLPPDLFKEARRGNQVQPVEFWLNPRMPAEAGQIGILVRQYAAAFNYLYSAIFGYQKVYVHLGGSEDKSWEKATNHSLNTLIMYFGRSDYAGDGDYLPFSPVVHALAGILLIFSLLPAMGCLASTSRQAYTAYEDRLLLASGYGPLMVTRLLAGALWWLLIIPGLLFLLDRAGVLVSFGITATLLFTAYLAFALLMLTLGRARAPAVTVLLAGWFIFFALLVLGGALYPISLFPSWLHKLASFSPLYPVMQPVYRAILYDVPLAGSQLTPAVWPLAPSLILALTLGRRRS